MSEASSRPVSEVMDGKHCIAVHTLISVYVVYTLVMTSRRQANIAVLVMSCDLRMSSLWLRDVMLS